MTPKSRSGKLWQYFWVRFFVGWLIVAVFPGLLLWKEYILRQSLLQTQLNSFFAVSISLFLSLLVLSKFARYPGQRSAIYVLPTIFMVSVCMALPFFVFRFGYSVYYVLISTALIVLFCFASTLLDKNIRIQQLAYIPLGRCKHFGTLAGTHWIVIDRPDIATNADAIVADLASPELTEEWQAFLTNQTLRGVPVYNNLQVFESLTGRSPIQHLYENNLGSLLPSQAYLYFKQVFETFIVLVCLPVALPIMLLTYLVVSLESKGSALFIQERIGQGGKAFHMYKFRSMVKDAEKHGAKLAQENDARITRFGHFIRKTRIDELPQIWNVLKGDMSLIGPRPEQRSFVAQFEKDIPFYNYRHIVKPGMTGWAQVTQGYAGDTDATIEKIQRDFYYIKHFSFTLDMLIVVKTAQIVITGFGSR